MDSRREPRFETELTVHFRQGRGVARNVSSSGLYFVTDVELDQGSQLSVTLDYTDSAGGPLRLRCEARVVRVERRGDSFGVAIFIDHFNFRRKIAG